VQTAIVAERKAAKRERARADGQFCMKQSSQTRAGARERQIPHKVNQRNASGRVQTASLTLGNAAKRERARANGQFDMKQSSQTRAGERKPPVSHW